MGRASIGAAGLIGSCTLVTIATTVGGGGIGGGDVSGETGGGCGEDERGESSIALSIALSVSSGENDFVRVGRELVTTLFSDIL